VWMSKFKRLPKIQGSKLFEFHWISWWFVTVQNPRSANERGLHERAMKSGHALPCTISYRSIPMKKNVDDSTMEMVDWPFLLPHDFVPWIESLTFFFNFCSPPKPETKKPTDPSRSRICPRPTLWWARVTCTAWWTISRLWHRTGRAWRKISRITLWRLIAPNGKHRWDVPSIATDRK
jgi:hypothetical protein